MDSNWRSPLQADSGQGIVNESYSLDFTAQTANSKWQEEVYQKIKIATDLYFAELHDIYQNLCPKFQQHESPSQQAKSELDKKLKFFKQMLDDILQYLQIPQIGIQHFHKDRLAKLEKRILGALSAHRASQPSPSLQQGEIPQPHLQSLQQNQQPHSEIHQTQSHESGVNSKLESVNVQGSLNCTAQTGNSDWQEEIYQKIKIMKNLYFAEMHDIHQKMCAKLLQHDSLSHQNKPDGVEKLKFFKQMLERILQSLEIPRNRIQPFHKERLPTLEKQILSILSSYRPITPGPPLQQGQNPQPHLQSLQQNQQSQSHESGVNSQLQSVNVQGSSVPTLHPGEISGLHGSVSSLSGINSSQPNMMDSFTEEPTERKWKREIATAGYGEAAVPKTLGLIHSQTDPFTLSASLDSTAHAANFDWQEEVYQKIKVVKDLYFAEMQDIYQKMCAKLLQHDSLSQQNKPEGVEKLKFFKQMLERILRYLEIPRNSIQPFHKERLPTLEKQILSILSSHRLRTPGPPLQQGQNPQPHLQSLQLNQQSQSHESGVNSQLQSVNVQGSSVPTLHPGEISGLHGFVSSLSGINSSQPNMMDSFTEEPTDRKRKREIATAGYGEAAVPKTLGLVHTSLDSTAHAANFDWQEEVYQKLKVLNDSYFTDIHAIYQETSEKLEQLKSPSQQANAEAVEELKFFKKTVEGVIQYLQIAKRNIQSFHKDKLPTLEKEILSILATPRDPITVRADDPQPDPNLELSLALKF